MRGYWHHDVQRISHGQEHVSKPLHWSTPVSEWLKALSTAATSSPHQARDPSSKRAEQ